MKFVNLMIVCPFCGEIHSVTVREDEYIKYLQGELVQNAFPTLTATQREQIISNICPSCQEGIFHEDEEEEEIEPSFFNEDFGFDPYCGSYTYDC